MKTKILLLAAAFCMALIVQAQAPQKFNYQGIARTGLGAPLANQTLGLEITILSGTTAQFVERHTATTSAIGLYTVQIGGGTAVTGTMGAVTWSAGNKNIKVGIDPNGGTNYTDMGTTELLSVPYALYAAGGTQGPQGPQGVAGPTGPAGSNGATGATGPQGPQGPAGSTGPAGPQGIAGTNGSDGADGTGVSILGSYNSLAALQAAHPTGNAGDAYLINGSLYVWSTNTNAWSNAGNIQGPTGPAGATGNNGATGAAGPIGATGPQGGSGPAGATGSQGPQGVAGPVGATGPAGTPGAAGATGPIGPAGTAGTPGATGAVGPIGPTGATGPQGPQGVPGTAGSYTAGTGVNISVSSVISSTLGTSIETAELENNAVTAVKIAPMGATNGQMLQYNGTAWAPATVAVGATGWGLSGNAATATDFIGTTNDQDLRFKRNGVAAGFMSENSTSFGNGSLSLSSDGGNTGFGSSTLGSNTTGKWNTAIGMHSIPSNTTGQENTGCGDYTLWYNTTGRYNTALGNVALQDNITGENNTGVGSNANVGAGDLSNATAIGAKSYVTQSNSLVLGSIANVNEAWYSTNVGIGTTAPSAALEIKSNSLTNVPQLRLRENTAEFTRVHFQNSNTGAWVLAGKKATNAANSVFNVFYSEGVDGNGGSDIMSLSGQGKVGINTSSTTTDPAYGTLGIRSTVSNVDNLTLLNSSSAGRWGFWVASTGNPDLRVYQNGTLAGTFSSTSGAYTSVSDRRLKENIVPVANVLDRIKDVEVMHYTFKSDESHQPQLGYIAQNLEEHFPEFVNKPDPKSERESFYTVNYAGMSAVAIKAIQEQQAMIEQLQQALANVQARLDQLEK